jgi:hypothetical protein
LNSSSSFAGSNQILDLAFQRAGWSVCWGGTWSVFSEIFEKNLVILENMGYLFSFSGNMI